VARILDFDDDVAVTEDGLGSSKCADVVLDGEFCLYFLTTPSSLRDTSHLLLKAKSTNHLTTLLAKTPVLSKPEPPTICISKEKKFSGFFSYSYSYSSSTVLPLPAS